MIQPASAIDDQSVVGEECHIHSAKENGPRYDPIFPGDKIDHYDNLLLLCRTHHKMVDDQTETFDADSLREWKSNHERWVADRLTGEERRPLKLVRFRNRFPKRLDLISSGRDLFNLLMDSHWYYFDHDEPRSEADVELIASFLQDAQDWGDIYDEIEAGAKVRVTSSLSRQLDELAAAGLFLFGAREMLRLEGGIDEPQETSAVHLAVRYEDSSFIVRPDMAADAETSNPRRDESCDV